MFHIGRFSIQAQKCGLHTWGRGSEWTGVWRPWDFPMDGIGMSNRAIIGKINVG